MWVLVTPDRSETLTTSGPCLPTSYGVSTYLLVIDSPEFLWLSSQPSSYFLLI